MRYFVFLLGEGSLKTITCVKGVGGMGRWYRVFTLLSVMHVASGIHYAVRHLQPDLLADRRKSRTGNGTAITMKRSGNHR